MKRRRIDFKYRFWFVSRKRSSLRIIKSFFKGYDLVTAKEMLNNLMICAGKNNTVIQEDSSVVFRFHQSLRSLLRACHVIALKDNQSTIAKHSASQNLLTQRSLSNEEYLNPILVFHRAFAEYAVKDFDYNLAAIVSLSTNTNSYSDGARIVAVYIHLVKILDAAYLIQQKDNKT